MTGLIFDDLKVIKRAKDKINNDGRNIIMWECKCVCGNVVEVRGDSLRRHHTKSCGCRRNKIKGNAYDLTGDYGIGYTSKGEEFYFDLDDYNLVSEYSWYKNQQGYFCSRSNGRNVRLHRLVMGSPDLKYDVDHRKHMLYDNRKNELRICNHSDNVHNHIIHNHNSSGVSGVYFETYSKKWRASIKFKNKTIYLGRFLNLDDAIKARKEGEEKYYGEYSYDNSQAANL